MSEIIYKAGALAALMMALLALPLSAAQEMPEIVILSPEDGATLPAGNVTVDVGVASFNVTPNYGEPAVEGEGHIHYFIDVPVPTAEGVPAVTAEGTYVHTANTSHTWEDVAPGMHNLSVELVNNDHTPLVPPVFTTVNVTVENDTAMTVMSAQGDGDDDGDDEASEEMVASSMAESDMAVDMTENMTGNMTAQNVTINLTAEDFAFDMDTITVPAGSNVTINFTNMDSGVPHNVAVYDSEEMEVTIFKGEIFEGVATMAYNFTAPEEAGEYYFQCDVHPDMNGSFVVE